MPPLYSSFKTQNPSLSSTLGSNLEASTSEEAVAGATVGVVAAQSHVLGRELGKHDDGGARKRTENEEDIIGRRRRNVYMCCGGLREECHIFVGRVKEDLTSKQEVRGDLPRINRPLGASKGHLSS